MRIKSFLCQGCFTEKLSRKTKQNKQQQKAFFVEMMFALCVFVCLLVTETHVDQADLLLIN